MKGWFDNFTAALEGSGPSSDLIGAGAASASEAISHYRYQHQIKIQETIESSFSVLRERFPDIWDELWEEFWSSGPASPRSLDFFPDVFLEYVLASPAANHFKDLAKFERCLEKYSWTNTSRPHCSLEAISGESKLELCLFEVWKFSTPVIGRYEGQDADCLRASTVMVWISEKGVQYRETEAWEIDVLKHLDLGINRSLEWAPEEPEKVSLFFQWLGSSGMVVSIIDLE